MANMPKLPGFRRSVGRKAAAPGNPAETPPDARENPAPEKVINVRLIADPAPRQRAWASFVRGAFQWLWEAFKNVALIGAAIGFVLFLMPTWYRGAVRLFLPPFFYKLGAMGDPEKHFSEFPDWPVDLAPVDNAPKDLKLAQFFLDQPMIARLGKDGYLIGRSDPKTAGDEAAGHSWQAGQCLFIRDFEFRVEHRTGAYKTDADGQVVMKKLENAVLLDDNGDLACQHPAQPLGAIKAEQACKAPTDADKISLPQFSYDETPLDHMYPKGSAEYSSYLTIKASDILGESHKSGKDAADYYLSKLLPELERLSEVKSNSKEASRVYRCAHGGKGTICPRIEIWAQGAVAPCGINPLSH